jgi:serine/threonine-protein kinase
MLIGKVPFRGDSPISIALQHINDDIEFTPDEKVSIPQSVRTIIKKLTEKSSVERYQSAEELIEDIEYIEKNIDLDFIKEYDNYATQKIDEKELNKPTRQAPIVTNIEDDDEYEELEEKPKRHDRKKNKKKKKQAKEDSPRAKKLWIAALVMLIVVLSTQFYLAFKFLVVGNKDNIESVVTPDVQNISLYDAQKQIEKLGLKVTLREEFNSDTEKNYVISQAPVAGTEVKAGDSISITISKGSREAEVPNVVGISLGEAENILKENKLKLGTITYEFSDSFKQGIVLRQDPKSGSGSVGEADRIAVVVSKGPKAVAPPVQEKDDKEEIVVPNPNPGGNNSESSNTGTGTTEKPGTGGTGTTEKPGTGGTGTTEKPGTGTTENPGTGGTGTTENPGTGESGSTEDTETQGSTSQ